MAFNDNWSYNRESEWGKTFSKCKKGKRQSPINIDTNKLSSCDLLCNIALKYSKSKCNVMVRNRTPIVNFDNGSFIKFIHKKEILQLRAMTIHIPSMHRVDGAQYDMEVILYHKFAGSLFTDSSNFVPGGTAISIMFQKGNDYGKHNAFFNSFINKIPNVENTQGEIDVKVGNNWGPELILPKLKSFYFYEGSLPFPPCNEGWKWIVFEEVQGLSNNIIETLKLAFDDNIRTFQSLNDGRVVSYNSNTEIPTDNEIEKKAREEVAKYDRIEIKKESSELQKDKTIIDSHKARTREYFRRNKKYFKNILIGIVYLFMIFTSLKFVKYIVKNDLLNKIMVKQALGISKEEGGGNNKSNQGAPPSSNQGAPPTNQSAPPPANQSAPPPANQSAPPPANQGAPPPANQSAPPPANQSAPPAT